MKTPEVKVMANGVVKLIGHDGSRVKIGQLNNGEWVTYSVDGRVQTTVPKA